MIEVLVYKGRNTLDALVVNGDVYESRDEGCRKWQLDTFEEFKSIVLDGGGYVRDGVMVYMFAGFEAGGDGIDGEEQGIADPVT